MTATSIIVEGFIAVTWINQPSPKEAAIATMVVRRPRDVDALGEALSAAFARSSAMPSDLAAALKALEHVA